jgi:hypothetical protein
MAWDEKCWGIFNNIYWTTRFIGMQGIKVTPELTKLLADQNIEVPKKSGRIYVREVTESDLAKKLLSQEEVLNHFFNITFDIACDEVVSQLLCQPLGIADKGPFASFSNGFQTRFGWSRNENVTQPDAFFYTEDSLICVELKLGSRTWPEQIGKYLALMHFEEQVSGKRKNLGLLFIVPENIRKTHLSKIGISDLTLDAAFLTRMNRSKLPTLIRNLFERSPESIESIRSRVRLESVSWTWLRDQLDYIESSLDCSKPGEQTLLRLLSGFRAQIESHEKTGIT